MKQRGRTINFSHIDYKRDEVLSYFVEILPFSLKQWEHTLLLHREIQKYMTKMLQLFFQQINLIYRSTFKEKIKQINWSLNRKKMTYYSIVDPLKIISSITLRFNIFLQIAPFIE